MAGNKYDGNGTTFKAGNGSAQKAGINTISCGGYSISVIDDSDLGNTAVLTKILANLRDHSDITLNIDFAALGKVHFAGKKECVIGFPQVGGSLTFWGGISSVANSTFQNLQSPTCDITITVTNLNDAGEETPPVLEIGEDEIYGAVTPPETPPEG